MSNVKAFKISTGEEIIAKIEKDGDGFIVLSKPRLVRAMQMQNGGVGIGLMPWCFSGGDEKPVTLFMSNIITIIEPIQEMIDNYLAETSGLDLSAAKPKSILTA